MSGHNKWSKIKRKKGAADAKRSKIFSRIIKEISVAVREGGSDDPDFNPRLRLAVANAKGVNMPKENIERAIKKASESGGEAYTEITYEGYGPQGVAVFVETTTDNPQRTVSNVRSYFNKSGGNLATNGSVDFLFERKGIFIIPAAGIDEDEFTLAMIDAGAEDIENDDGELTITTSFDNFGAMQKALEERGIEVSNAELQRIPLTTKSLELGEARRVLKLIDTLEEDDDIQAVFHNLELTEDLLSEIDN